MQNYISYLFKNVFLKDSIKILNKLKSLEVSNEVNKLKYQKPKLIEILKLIKNIEWYNGVAIDLKNIDYNEFRKLPILTKDDIRNCQNKLINLKYNSSSKIYKNTSGGSTGEPVTFFQTKEQKNHGLANFYYANYLNGIDIFKFSVDLWGAERDMHNVNKKFNLIPFLYNKIFLNTFVLSNDIIRLYIEKLNKYKPEYIKAYVHSIYDISKYINENNISIKFQPIIHCTTGPLYPEMRLEIKKAFNNTHVYSFYGSREVSAIASEGLNEDGFNVLFDNVFLEILDQNNEPVKYGEEGEVVVTTLNNKYMPLIRYRIGDRAIKGDNIEFGCLRIKEIVGRTLGVIYTVDGKKIDGQFFTTLFFGKAGINNFQIIQRDLLKIDVFIVKNSKFKIEELDYVIERIRKELKNVDINIIYTNNIELNKTGKRMYVYSEIDFS